MNPPRAAGRRELMAIWSLGVIYGRLGRRDDALPYLLEYAADRKMLR